jgi:hypothetical protein
MRSHYLDLNETRKNNSSIQTQHSNHKMSYTTAKYAPMATAVPVEPVKAINANNGGNCEISLLLQRQPSPLDENQVQRLLDQGYTRGM